MSSSIHATALRLEHPLPGRSWIETFASRWLPSTLSYRGGNATLSEKLTHDYGDCTKSAEY